MNLQDIFGKFTGRILKDPMRPLCDDDVLLDEMKATAAQYGLTLRVRWPGSVGDCRENLNRVNLAVKKESNGKLYIQNKFWLG